MSHLFHITVCLLLIIFQTAVKPQLLFLNGFYDILLAYVIYLGLYHRVRQTLPIILISGIVMDAISGGPMGLFLTSYLWVFLLARWVTRLIHRGNLVLRFFSVAVGVIFQTGVYVGTTLLLGHAAPFADPTLAAASVQTLWALGTGGILITSFRHAHQHWERFLNTYLVRDAAQGG